MRKLTLPALLAAALLVAACDRSPALPEATTLSDAEVAALAPALEAIGAGMVDESPTFSLGVAAEQRQSTIRFTRTRTCAAGGTVTVEGTSVRSYDADSRTLVVNTDAIKTPDACAHAVRRGEGTVAVTGDPNLRITAARKRVDGAPYGLQTLTLQGAFTWARSTGGSGSCTVDLLSTLNPDAGTRTVKGTFCGREVERTVAWTPGRG